MAEFLRSPGQYAKRLFHDLRLEGSGREREAAAMGVGAFIGCLPVYGAHLLLVIAVGRWLGLNRMRMYIAANISNPIVAPVLILAEIQAGAFVRRGAIHDLTLSAVRATDPWIFGIDLVIGSVVVGVVVGLVVAALTWASVSGAPPHEAHLTRLFDGAAYRFLEVGVTAWEFARAKLRRDPVYGAALAALPRSGDTLVDVGCGQGLALAVLVEAAATADRGEWPPGLPSPPRFERLVGIDARPRVAQIARRVLGGAADIILDSAPRGLPARVTAALVFDVLHLMSAADQEQLVVDLRARLDSGGVVLVRDVDAAAGAGFHAVRIGNRIKNLAVGQFRQAFHFRTADEWTALFTRAGWTVERSPMGDGTPFANVMFKLT
jgi:uncharacterized protein (DUF2062 family)/SAM-dependent methyltransferase